MIKKQEKKRIIDVFLQKISSEGAERKRGTMAFRTDLAIENKEMYDESRGNQGEIPGVEVKVRQETKKIKVTRIAVKDETGSRIMGKPCGNYITIEAEDIVGAQETEKKEAARVVAGELKRLIPFDYHLKVLVAGLGNDRITPDSLGPHTAEKVRITRHFFLMFDADGDEEMACVSGIIPGVTGSTGLETAELIRKAAEIAGPDVIIAIDSLAARNLERISSTIQISDTGISPGAGTGNMRTALNEETLGIRVVAIGVPTVIDAKTLIVDSLEGYLPDMTGAERYVDGRGIRMIVTSTEIDQVIEDFSDIIAEGINRTLHPGLNF